MKVTNKLTTKPPRTQFKVLVSQITSFRVLFPGMEKLREKKRLKEKVKRKSGAGEESLDNKLRNYWTKQSQTDFFVAGLCRTFHMFIISL